MGAYLRQHGRRRLADRHREGQARHRLSGAPPDFARAGEESAPELAARIQAIAKRIYKTLELDGYARIDFRLSADGVPYFLEANPNPEIAESQEFAAAAKHDGIKYRDLLHRILTLGMQRAAGTVARAEKA